MYSDLYVDSTDKNKLKINEILMNKCIIEDTYRNIEYTHTDIKTIEFAIEI